MCDYSLHHVANRPAKIEDKLVATKFHNSITRGFAAVGQPNVAVCLLPGTEIAFDESVECQPSFGVLPNKKIGQRLARFRQVNLDNPVAHHDALEFPDGQVVLVTRLCDGQRATVLQLPAGSRAATAEETVVSGSFASLAFDLIAQTDTADRRVQYKVPPAPPVARNSALAIGSPNRAGPSWSIASACTATPL